MAKGAMHGAGRHRFHYLACLVLAAVTAAAGRHSLVLTTFKASQDASKAADTPAESVAVTPRHSKSSATGSHATLTHSQSAAQHHGAAAGAAWRKQSTFVGWHAASKAGEQAGRQDGKQQHVLQAGRQAGQQAGQQELKQDVRRGGQQTGRLQAGQQGGRRRLLDAATTSLVLALCITIPAGIGILIMLIWLFSQCSWERMCCCGRGGWKELEESASLRMQASSRMVSLRPPSRGVVTWTSTRLPSFTSSNSIAPAPSRLGGSASVPPAHQMGVLVARDALPHEQSQAPHRTHSGEAPPQQSRSRASFAAEPSSPPSQHQSAQAPLLSPPPPPPQQRSRATFADDQPAYPPSQAQSQHIGRGSQSPLPSPSPSQAGVQTSRGSMPQLPPMSPKHPPVVPQQHLQQPRALPPSQPPAQGQLDRRTSGDQAVAAAAAASRDSSTRGGHLSGEKSTKASPSPGTLSGTFSNPAQGDDMPHPRRISNNSSHLDEIAERARNAAHVGQASDGGDGGPPGSMSQQPPLRPTRSANVAAEASNAAVVGRRASATAAAPPSRASLEAAGGHGTAA